MAALAEYQQWLVDAIKSGDKRFAHLAQYGLDAPFYGGLMGDGAFQNRINGYSLPQDLGGADGLSARSGAEILAKYRGFADAYGANAVKQDAYEASPEELAQIDKARENGAYQFGEPILSGAHTGRSAQSFADEYYAKLLGELPGQIDPNKQYLTRNIDVSSFGGFGGDPAKRSNSAWVVATNGGTLHELGSGDNPAQRLAGMEQIRSGELDNAVNGITGQLNDQFEQRWGSQIEPALRKRGITGDLGAAYNKAKQLYMDSVDWSKLIRYDPNVGMYTDMGAVKHVNDAGMNVIQERWLPAMMAVGAAITGGTAGAALGEMAGTAASSAVGGMTAGAEAGAAGGAAAGSTAGATAGTVGGATAGGAAAGATTAASAAGTIAGGATQGLVGSLIGSAMTGNRVTGKNLATSMLMGGLTPYANANWAQYLSKPGVALLLEAARQAATNKGRIDPRTLAANTAGNLTAGWVGDKLSDSGIVGRLLGGSAGSVVRQSLAGNGIDGNSTLLAGIGNTSTAGQLLAKAAGAYQRQMALRQQLAQRGGR